MSIQLNRMQRANKEGHRRRMVEVRYVICMSVLIVGMACIIAAAVTKETGIIKKEATK